MTADILKVLEMRDALVAAEVAKMAELGWFETEFTIYGCAYYKNGERQYRLSAEPEKIYDFMEYGAQYQVLPSDIMMLSERYPVPIGMQDAVVLEVKKILARKMQEAYTVEFFEFLSSIKEAAQEERGYAYLLRQQEAVTGCFDKKALKRFETLAAFVYQRGKITKLQYEHFIERIREESNNIEDETISKEISQKTLYAIAYKNMGRIKYVINARKSTIYRKQHELMKKGIFTSPIFSQTYYYRHDTNPAELNQKFTEELEQFATLSDLEELEAVMCRNDKITKAQFETYLQETKQRFGEKAYETLLSYGCRWGIL